MYSIIVFLIIISCSLRIFSRLNFFSCLDEGANDRMHNLDGLRAMLAMFVVYHHTILRYNEIRTGKWSYTESLIFNNIGSIGVSLFFMITGFLFWGRVSGKKNVEWVKLFNGRLFRIGPLYLFVTLISAFIILAKSDFIVSQNNLINFRGQLSTILFMGMDYKPHAFMNNRTFIDLIGPTWTLYYEWLFYLSLPALSLLKTSSNKLIIIASSFFFFVLINNETGGVFFIKLFLLGMIAYELRNVTIKGVTDSDIKLSIIFVVSLILSTQFSDGHHVYNNSSAVCLGVAFFTIVKGCSMFGVLTSKGATRIGNMSYSVYLTHSIVIILFLQTPSVMSLVKRYDAFTWFCTALAFTFCFLMSMLTFLFIEKRGIEMGKKAYSRLIK